MEPDIERYTGSDAINKHYNMNRLINDIFQDTHGYVTPAVSETQIDVSKVLCASPNSDYVEDMTTGYIFDNWI